LAQHYQNAESIVVRSTPGKVYEALTNWKERMAWRKGLILQYEGPDRSTVGQVVTASVEGSTLFAFKITGLEPPYRIFMEYTGKPLKGRWSIEIIPDGPDCHVTFYWLRVEPVGFFASLYFKWGFGLKTHQRRTRQTLKMLKEYVEKPL
jgi:Polyketide cyclase / dehydrase and lipid transport